MTTTELILELKEYVDSEDRSEKSEIQRICSILKSGGHDRYFIADGHSRNRWEAHISNVETYAKHPRFLLKAKGAISMMRSGLPG